MLFFTVNNWKLEPTPELLQVVALRDILQADRTRDKKEAMADLLYIYGMMQPRGPFSDYPIATRDRNVRKHCYGEVDAGPHESSHPARWGRIVDGIRAYMDHNDNADQRLVDELAASVDWVTNSLKAIRAKPDVTAKDIRSMIAALGEVNNLLVNKQQAEKLLKVGLDAAKAKAKGGVEGSMLERGMFRGVLEK